MNKTISTTRTHPARSVTIAVATILICAAVFSWGWNSVASNLAGLPQASFASGLATAATIMAIAFVVRVAIRFATHLEERSGH